MIKKTFSIKALNDPIIYKEYLLYNYFFKVLFNTKIEIDNIKGTWVMK